VRAAARLSRLVYLRFGKKPMPHLPRADAGFELGKASLIREGEDLSFLIYLIYNRDLTN
jgi:transketolase